ncbi:MAG: hypothetical protein ACEQSM_06150 [Aliarcobacter sp.]
MSTLQKNPKKDHSPPSGGRLSGLDWKAFFKRTIVLVFLISLAVHVLLLVGFGGVAIFKGKMPTMPFAAQNVPSEQAVTVAPPPIDEVVPEEARPDEMMPKDTSVAEESAPPLEMMTVPGGASWAPAIPKDIKTSLTGSVSGSGAGAAKGTGQAGVKLFGITVEAKKLGVLVDISGSMQKYIPKVMDEIFKSFPDADVVFMNGCGVEDWDEALKNWTATNDLKQKTAKENKTKFIGPKSMPKPQVVRFNSAEASDCPPIRGTQSMGGFRKDYPELYDKLAKRSNTWMVTSYEDAHAGGLAFEQFARRKVQAIYWFADFANPVVGKAADDAAKIVLDNNMEILIHSTKGVEKVGDWLAKVKGQVVQTKL